LGLLGISLFSLSLSQLKPVNAHADSTGEQTEVIADSSIQSSKPASENSSNGESTSQSNLNDTSSGSDNGSSMALDSGDKNIQSNNNNVNTAMDNVQTPKLPISNTKTLKRNNLIRSDAPTPSNLVVIKNGDSSVQLDNKLKLSVDQTPTLGKVMATNSDNFTYDEGTQTAIITNPTATDAVTAEYKNITIHQVGSKDMSSPETTILHSGQKVILYLVKGENGKYNLINDGASIFIKNMNHGSAFYTRGNDSVQMAFSKIVN